MIFGKGKKMKSPLKEFGQKLKEHYHPEDFENSSIEPYDVERDFQDTRNEDNG